VSRGVATGIARRADLDEVTFCNIQIKRRILKRVRLIRDLVEVSAGN
jgi:hypothetical protein